jgi:lysophospholipase L1-like esterase
MGTYPDMNVRFGHTPPGRSSRFRSLILLGVVAAVVGLGIWLWRDLSARPAIYVVGDSITSLSAGSISTALSNAGYDPTIRATPGVKIGQAQNEVMTLAQNQPHAWIIELGTNDAGANDNTWLLPFLAEWNSVAPASCVIYVTISPRAGPVGTKINAAIQNLAATHRNVHVLDWGNVEYSNPSWVYPDQIHPTPQGQAALASLETQELQRVCGAVR